MIWLAWRQFRLQATVIYAALAALGVVLAVTGPRVAELFRTSGEDFFDLLPAHGRAVTVYYIGFVAVLALPAVIGAFWGAPLVTRELETGTHRLVWNQTVTRTRWLATKLGLTGLAAMAAAGLLSLAVTWWSRPIDQAIEDGHTDNGFVAIPRLSPGIFDGRGIAPIGYAAFAVALGVTAGAVIRRTVPAMAVTLAVFVAVQFAMPLWVRPHIAAPEVTTTTITASNLRNLYLQNRGDPVESIAVDIDAPGAWIISNRTVDAAGQVASTLPAWVVDCVAPPGQADPQATEQACFTRLADLGYRQVVTYQPASRYWTIQWYETGIFLTLALLLTGLCFWRIRRLS